MNTVPAPRRQSLIDISGGGTGASPSQTATAGAAASSSSSGVHYSSSSGGGAAASRPGLLITPASQHGRRLSVVNPSAVAAVAVPAYAAVSSKSYENSYKTSPEKQFCAKAAKRILREVMETTLEGKGYDTDSCKHLTASLADAIKKRVKELGHPRYKLVTHVAIGQAENATLAFASRCVWNDSFDSFAEYTYKNGSLYAVGLVHALYCD